ncbi:TRM11 family SAM-dependent methyltransferase [Eubacterium multiforme]|uniref:tRNA G10 N-methylase Trm11 n=1 Tax=Eubacterium multiforme TaxID=83339 RepID=A0ABT9UVM4_9FIRM|nr:DNA methyltransferase [Eubacterium multiforme]MDQ0150375.1 tRNA G10 N-methylase Trm11 [Eubacterium multiforme]
MDYNKENKKYFYAINYQKGDESLCNMEMKYLFGKAIKDREFFSSLYINPSRSPFIKECIKVIYIEESLNNIIENIIKDKLALEGFKVCYIKSLENDNISYKERLNSMREIGLVIKGIPDMHNPKVNLAIMKLKDKWIFGIYEKNELLFLKHNKKPFSYSNALSTKVARALVNIAVGENINKKVIDPCCGVGTVVIEGISMGVNIIGYEINKQIAFNAKRNMEALGYEVNIVKGDMHNIKDQYDVAILDMPYGLFTKTTPELQRKIIETTRRISKKAIIITFENMDDMIEGEGFNIIDKGIICKNNFKRYINVCI